jgi:hypothetical protein
MTSSKTNITLQHLQAGHFNDFLFVSLLRAATFAAIKNAGPNGLPEDEFGAKVQQALGFTAENQNLRQEWMLDPDVKGVGVYDAERVLSRVLSYRVWTDQRRGWRYTNPNLEQLGLITARYVGIEELSSDADVISDIAGAGFILTKPECLAEIFTILLWSWKSSLGSWLFPNFHQLLHLILYQLQITSRQLQRPLFLYHLHLPLWPKFLCKWVIYPDIAGLSVFSQAWRHQHLVALCMYATHQAR